MTVANQTRKRSSALRFALIGVLAVAAGFVASPLDAAIVAEETVTGSTSTGNVTLTSWTPGANELVLVAVAVRDETAEPVTVSGNGLTFVEIHNVDNAQGQNGIYLFRAMGASPSTGSITVTITGNASPAFAAATRFSGVDTSGTDGSGAVEATASNPGPPVTDDADMQVDITTLTNDAWAFAAGTHRNSTFTEPVGETPISTNNLVGSSGEITTLSTWYESVPVAGTVTLGGNGVLNGARDWAVAAVSIKPAGASNSPPTLTVDEPDGTGDTVTVGDSYNIQYDLADSDDVVTAAFYYDTDNSGLDGTAISGACASGAEGTDVTCSWDTTGVTPGSYYVYGITNDGTNPDVTDYSLGEITINASTDVTVGASGTQTSSMFIPSTNQYVGGKFVIVDNTGSRNVTGITITESGTVDAANNLTNIELWYEIDNTAPYDGASVSVDGNETQFGSTVGAFSLADGTAAFAGSVGIDTTSAMVVYVVFDVGAGAVNEETVEISINNPSTEVTVDSGTVGPATAAAISGTTTLAEPGFITTSIPQTFDSGSKFYSHCANGYYWVAVRDASSTNLWSSSDGKAWTSQGAIFSFYPVFQEWAVRYSGNTVIAFGYNPGDDIRYYSKGTLESDGSVTWDETNVPTGAADTSWTELNALIANDNPVMWRAGPTNADSGRFTIGDQLDSPISWGDTADAPSLGPPAIPGNGTGGGFSAGAIFPTGGSDPNDLIILRATTASSDTLGNHRLVAIKFDASMAAFDTEWYNVSTIGGTLTEDTSTEVQTHDDEGAHRRFAAVRDSNGDIHAVYVNQQNRLAHYRKAVGFNDDWSQISTDVAQASTIPKVGLTALPDGHLLLFYERNNNLYRRRFDGTSWGAERLVLTTPDLQRSLGTMESAGVCTPGIAVTTGTANPFNVSFVIPANLSQTHYRWRNDDGDESGATWTASEDTKLTGLTKSTIQRLRFQVANTGTDASGAATYQLQVAETATCSTGIYAAVPTVAGSDWQVVDSSWITDPEATTNVASGLSDPAGLGFVAGEIRDAANATGGITLADDEFTEIEFAVQANGGATDGGDYCFRLYDATNNQVLDNYTAYAEVQLAGGSPSGGVIYYSVGTDTNPLYSDTASASTGTLTLNSPAANKIGVGDEIRLGANRYYITGRNSATEFTIQNSAANGGTPGDTNITFGSTAITIFRAFNTLSAAEAGSSDASHLNASDLVAGNFQLNWTCYDDGAMNDGITVIDGWTTGPANYIRIYTPTDTNEVGASQRHTGTAGTGFRLTPSFDLTATLSFWYIEILEEYVRIEGIEVDGSGLTNGRRLSAVRIPSTVSSTSDLRFNKMIVHHFINSNVDSGNDADVFGFQIQAGTVKVSNSIVYRLEQFNTHASASVQGIYVTGGTSHLHNNTVYNIKHSSGTATGADGIKNSGGTVAAINNAVFDVDSSGGAEACFNGTITQSNNVSSDATAVGPQNQTSYASYFVSITPGSENLHLLNDSNSLWGSFGGDLDSDPDLPVTDDIDGGTRDASNPDIGADEFGAAALVTIIYRSVGTTATALESGTTNAMTISGSTATFAVGLTDNIGVGDAIQYDSDGNSTIDAIAFIHGRTSSTEYTVKDAAGDVPTAVAGDNDWELYRAYTSLSNWEAQNENDLLDDNVEDFDTATDLVSSNTQIMVACYGDGADTTSAEINGWTTGRDNYIKIYTPTSSSEVGTSQRHSGVWDALAYRISQDGTRFAPIIVRERYVRIDGLQIESNLEFAGESNGIHVVDWENDAPVEFHITNNIIRMTAAPPSTEAFGIGALNNFGDITLDNSLYVAKVWNNIIYGYTAAGGAAGVCLFGADYGTLYAFNNTCVGGSGAAKGIASFNNVDFYAKNNVSIDSTDPYFGTYHADSTNNVSDIGDAPGSNPKNGEPTFLNKALNDYHLESSDTVALGQGTNLSSDSNLAVTDDIDGEARDASTPDIGADEFAAGIDVTVDASGSQTVSMSIPSTNQYVGGKFVVVDSTSSRNVTGITISESGTVDALNDVDNIKLFYELDTTAPYDGASESYVGTEAQFGVTDTNGFSAANGTSSFTGSVGINTTSAMVVYVVFDVGAGATNGETVEISIEDPSTEVIVDSGTVEPATPVAISGTTILNDGSNAVTLADATGGQIDNQFTSASYALDIVFHQFRLTRSGTLDVSELDVTFTTANGVANGDVANAELWEDIDGNGVWDSGTDLLIQGTVTPSGGVITFTTDFTPATTGTNYFVVVDVTNLTTPDYTTVSLSAADIDLTAGLTLGSATDAVHAATLCPSDWWDCDWRKRRVITFDNLTRGALNDFPAMLCLSDPDEIDYSATQDLGQDVRFIDDSGSGPPLSHEIEQWNESGVSYLWVKVPQIDGSSNTDFVYLYYDNPTVSDGQNVADVWSNQFESVYHLSDDFADSTGIHGPGNNNGSTDGTTTRLAGDYQTFGGNAAMHYIDTNWTPSYGNGQNFVFEGWLNVTNVGGTDAIMGIEDRFPTGDLSEIRLAVREIDPGQNPVMEWDNLIDADSGTEFNNTTAQTLTNEWHHVALVRDGSTARTYLDGSEVHFGTVQTGAITFPTRAPWSTTNTLLIGAQWNTEDVDGVTRNWMQGDLDEVRTSIGTARDANWFDATYDNIKNCGSFSSAAPEEPTPSCTWGYRKTLTIDPNRVGASCAADVMNFPMLVSLTNDNDLRSAANGGNVANANGYDILFRDTNGNDLDFEIEEYDAVNGTLNAWVKIPTLDFDDPTVVYAYYGNPCVSTPQENPEAVWGTDFKGVWHSHDDLLDSTQYNNDVTTPMTSNATGQIADADVYDGVGDYNTVDDGGANASLNVGNEFTVSAWVKWNNPGPQSEALVSKVTEPTHYSFKLYYESDVLRFEVGDDVAPTFNFVTGPVVSGDSDWHHIVGRTDGSELRVFFDGVKHTNSTPLSVTVGYDDAPLWIGASQWTSGPGTFADAVIDEVRLNDVALTDCWIETEFNNQSDPVKNPACDDAGFYCLGTQQTTAVGLTSFEATALDGAVLLKWVTGSEIDNLGFHLYRSDAAAGTYERITAGVIPGLGSSPEGASYNYVDYGRTNGQTYYYKLEDIETTGATEMHGPVSATPEVGASAGDGEVVPGEQGGAEEGGPEENGASRITYGSPWENEVHLRQVNGRTLELELLTKGFYAYPEEDGSVRLVVPGLDLFAAPGEPAVPVYRGLVEALVGLQVRVGPVRVDEVDIFTSLRPSSTEAPSVIGSSDGTTRAEKKKVKRKFLKGKGLYPETPARLVEVVFQEEVKKALVEMSPIRWDEDGARLLLAKRMTVRVRFAGVERSEKALAKGGGRRHVETHETRDVLARFVTTEAGLYGVAFEDVFEKGAPAIDRSKLRLSHQGETVAFRVMPGAKKFNRNSVLYFISEGADANPYGQEAVYELELSGAGVVMDNANAEPYGTPVLEYWRTVSREENRLYQAAFVEAEDVWQWDWIFGPMTKSFTFDVENLAASPSPSTLEIWLQGASDFPELDHHARVYVNGTLVTEEWWDGETGVHLTAELGPGVLHEGANELQIEEVGDTDALYSMIMLDRFEVSYPSQLVANEGELKGRFDRSGTAWVSDLENAYAFDVTGEHPLWLDRVNHAEGVGFGTEAGHEYLLVSGSSLRSPEVRKPLVTSLRSEVNAAEYLVIGPREYLGAAEPLLRYRLNEGLRTMAVAVEDIYSEFGYGEATAESIREFLSYAYHHWNEPTVRYVVLLGDATYDTKDYLATGVVNQVPAKLVKTQYVWTASDPWLAAVNGEDQLPDLAIGRLPEASVEEVQAMVAKILAYETGAGNPDAPVVLVTDNPDGGGDFDWNAQDLTDTVLLSLDVDKIQLSKLGTTATRSAILNAFDEGPSIMSYIGHGGIEVWANENLLHREDVATLSPQSQQALLFTMNCLNGYFHFPYRNSLAEELLKAEDKGIIAAFSPAGLSQDEPAHRFHKLLLDEFVNRKHERLGDAILAGQAGYADTGALPELLSIYHLLGDPALNLR